MSDRSKKLQESLAELLNMTAYMCSQSIIKAKILLEKVEKLNTDDVPNVNNDIKNLLERISSNVTEFTNKFNKSVEDFSETQVNCDTTVTETKPSKGKKFKLSLIRRNDTQETDTDVDLGNTEQETLNKKQVELEQVDKSSSDDSSDEEARNSATNEQTEPKQVGNEVNKQDSDDSSDEDSQNTIPLGHFDVETINPPIEVLDDRDQVTQDNVTDDVKLDSEETKIKTPPLTNNEGKKVTPEDIKSDDEEMSFDFGDLNEEIENNGIKNESKKEKVNVEPRVSEFDFTQKFEEKIDHEQIKRDNAALLKLLSENLDVETPEDELEKALKQLENSGDADCFVVADKDSDDDDDDDDGSSLSSSDVDLEKWTSDLSEDEIRFKRHNRTNIIDSDDSDDESSDSEEKDKTSPNENEKEERINPELKECYLKIRRLDEMSDSETDVLCDLHNLNKRKFHAELELNNERKGIKRRKILSPSSSNSSDSESDSATPDLLDLKYVEDFNSRPPSQNSLHSEHIADIIAQNMNKSDCDISSNSDSESEEITTRKKTETVFENNNDDDVQSVNEMILAEEDKEESDTENDKTKKSDWRNDPLLDPDPMWADSERSNKAPIKSEGDSDKEVEKTRKVMSKQRCPRQENGEEYVLSDSDSEIFEIDHSSSSDCEILEDLEAVPAEGRRNIRPIMSDEELTAATQKAKYEEDQRIQRLEELSRTMESIQSQREEFILDAEIESGKPLITVDHNLVKKLKPHQKNGVQFMWEACYESVKMLQKSKGTGCILAHCMGLGKTLQVITLIHTLFTYKSTKTNHVLIVCPLSTVDNWKKEFKLAFRELDDPPQINISSLINEDNNRKFEIIQKWRERCGVLLLGYEAFRILASDQQEQRIGLDRQAILKKALIDPGPDLVVCDEGHILKNEKALKFQALTKVKTQRRIILTGTPLQNNLKEYYEMVHFVKPNLLGTHKEFANRFLTPIMNGQYYNSTSADVKIMKKRTHVLNKLLKKTIHRVDSNVLEEFLPKMTDYTIYLKMHPVQIGLYKNYIDSVRNDRIEQESGKAKQGYFFDFQIIKYIGLHPQALSIYYNKKRKREALKQNNSVSSDKQETISDDWYVNLCPSNVLCDIECGTKMKIIMNIIDESVRAGDKLLIFSVSLDELDCIEFFLKTKGTDTCSQWKIDRDYLKLDGRVHSTSRSSLCDKFNDERNMNIKLFLISQKIGGLGLNLTAANRVIIVSANFNPCLDTQSIYRVYRFGQVKKCFVYRLLSIGTMEEVVYQKCVLKLGIARTVIDKCNITRHFSSKDIERMYSYDFNAYNERPIPSVPKDKLLAHLLQYFPNIYKYMEHNILLENIPDEELNDEEKKLAWEEYNNMEASGSAVSVAPSSLVQPILPPPSFARYPELRSQLLSPYFPRIPAFNRGHNIGTRNNFPLMVPNSTGVVNRGGPNRQQHTDLPQRAKIPLNQQNSGNIPPQPAHQSRPQTNNALRLQFNHHVNRPQTSRFPHQPNSLYNGNSSRILNNDDVPPEAFQIINRMKQNFNQNMNKPSPVNDNHVLRNPFATLRSDNRDNGSSSEVTEFNYHLNKMV